MFNCLWKVTEVLECTKADERPMHFTTRVFIFRSDTSVYNLWKQTKHTHAHTHAESLVSRNRLRVYYLITFYLSSIFLYFIWLCGEHDLLNFLLITSLQILTYCEVKYEWLELRLSWWLFLGQLSLLISNRFKPSNFSSVFAFDYLYLK